MRVLILSALLLAGCGSTVQRYAPIDLTAKSVTVSSGSSGLLGKIKTKLTEAGWKMVVYRGPEVTRGKIGPETELSKADTFNSRYALDVSWNSVDMCLTLQPLINYDISLIDNDTGAEVITMSGRGCEQDVANEFAGHLAGK